MTPYFLRDGPPIGSVARIARTTNEVGGNRPRVEATHISARTNSVHTAQKSTVKRNYTFTLRSNRVYIFVPASELRCSRINLDERCSFVLAKRNRFDEIGRRMEKQKIWCACFVSLDEPLEEKRADERFVRESRSMCVHVRAYRKVSRLGRGKGERRGKKKKKETFKVKGTSTLIPKMGQKFLVGEEGGVVR